MCLMILNGENANGESSPYNFDNGVSVDDDVDCSVKRHFDFVRFYKNGKKAIYRISDLENIGLM